MLGSRLDPRARRRALGIGAVVAAAALGLMTVNFAGAAEVRPSEETRALARLASTGTTDPQVKAIVDWLAQGARPSLTKVAASAEGATITAHPGSIDRAPLSAADLDRAGVLSQRIVDSSMAMAALWQPNEATYHAASATDREQMIVSFVTRNKASLNDMRTTVLAAEAELERISNGD